MSLSSRIRAVLAAVLLSALLGWTAVAGAATSSPRQTVERFNASLIEVMKRAAQLDFAGRYAFLEPKVAESFNLPLMIRVAAGSSWRHAAPAEQVALAAAFKRMSVSTYASRFDGFSGESFETLGERAGPQKTTLVDTRLNRPDDDPVKITYVTRKAGEDWKIVDVLVDGGISELAVRHSEYRKVLKDGGVAALVRELKAKADKLAAGS